VSDERILIAGGAGFVGSHLAESLLERGARVVVLDSFVTGRMSNLEAIRTKDCLSVEEADISSALPGSVLGQRFTQIYQLASPASPADYARFPLETLRANSIGTMNLLDLAFRDSARFVLASTSEVYGDPGVHPQPETYWGNVNPIGPRSCYDEGKRFAESLTMNYTAARGVDARIARIFNTYGPRSAPGDGRMIPNFCVQALQDEPVTVYGDGHQTRSCCYVTDLVRGLVALMETDGLQGEVVNLGNPDERTVREIAIRIIGLAGSRSTILHEPLPADDPARRRPDVTKAARLLRWSPLVDLETGLKRTLEHFTSLGIGTLRAASAVR
jgi:nucleoside-diphosphate-sugar epimerase